MSDSLQSDAFDGFDPDDRALCPDGACIGVLDKAGRCKVCGRQSTAASVVPASQYSPELPGLPGSSEQPASMDALAKVPSDREMDTESDDFADRQLCADPSCIGVLDAAGRCKACGLVAKS